MSLCTHYRSLELGPFITAHDGDIIQYSIFTLLTLFTGPYRRLEQENPAGCPDSHTMASCSINIASSPAPAPHGRQVVIWQYSHKYAHRWSIQHDKWKSHARYRQPGTDENLFSFWVQCHSGLYPNYMLQPASLDITTKMTLGLVLKQIN